MTEQEYIDIYDLGRLRAVQKILVECLGDVGALKEEAYKAMRKCQIRVNKIELIESTELTKEG